MKNVYLFQDVFFLRRHFYGGIIFLFLLLLSFMQVQAQGRVVTGTVTNDEGERMPGVNIQVSGTSAGTVTDLRGEYRIDVPSGADTLTFSFIGYLRKELAVGNRSVIDVVLMEDVKSLSEVVVVGYGTQKKRQITSAVSSVTEEEFNRGNVNDPYTLMQGKVAGLNISKAGSNPNRRPTVRLRGISTLGGNAEPLVVVDGVIGMNLNGVDPNDIASIDVLKDASAAAIYGSRGASGVIIITTKKGKKGKARVEYNPYVSVEEVAKFPSVMTAEEFREAGVGEDYGASTNWLEETTQTAISHAHNISISGGAKKTTYRASVNYRDIQGIALNTGYDRLNARVNLKQRTLNDMLTLSMNLTGTMLTSEGGPSGAFRQAVIYNPTAPVRSDDPEYEKYGGYFQKELYNFYNPVALLEQQVNERQTNLYNINLQAEFEPVKGVVILARYNRERYIIDFGRYTSKFSFGRGMDRNGYAERDEHTNNKQLFESTATYENRVGDLEYTGLVGYSYQERNNRGFNINTGDFLTDAFQYNNLSASQDINTGISSMFSYRDMNKIIGFFGRVQLNYDNTYFLQATLRREGSTMFGEGNKWGNFPSVSAGVDVSRLVDIPQVNNLKLRASYGVAGNTPGSPYLSQLRMRSQGNFFYNGGWIPAYAPSTNPNPYLQWEEKRELDIGFDFTVLDTRLSGSFDYYDRRTNNLIYPMDVNVPPNLVPTTQLNVGEISARGLEAALNYNAINTGDFSWTTSVNGVYFLNNTLVTLSDEGAGLEFGGRRVTSTLGVPGLNTTPATVVEEGAELGTIWGYRYTGLTEDGMWTFEDLNDDGTYTDEDRQVIGNGLPDFQLGFNNSFVYGNFDLNFFFRGTFGHDLVNTQRVFYENPTGRTYNVVNTKYYNENLREDPEFSSLYVEDASYLMLDNASLGYNLPIKNGGAFSRVRFYLSGQNLFVITGYTGVDPEVRQANPLAPGVDDRNTWYRTRTYTFGVNLGF